MAWQNYISQSNNTSDVTILTAPANGYSRAIPAGCINFFNKDVIDHTIILQLHTTTPAPADYILDKITIEANVGGWSNDKNIYCLDEETQTLEIFLNETHNTNPIDIFVTYRDEAQ